MSLPEPPTDVVVTDDADGVEGRWVAPDGRTFRLRVAGLEAQPDGREKARTMLLRSFAYTAREVAAGRR